MTDSSLASWLTQLAHIFKQPSRWLKLHLQPKDADLVRITLRPVVVKAQDRIAAVYQYTTSEQTHILAAEDALELVASGLDEQSFKNMTLLQQTCETQIKLTKKGKALIQSKTLAADHPRLNPAPLNREKNKALTLDRPFLKELGVTDSQEMLIPAMARKWKQINKFIEVFDHAFAASYDAYKDKTLHIVDFGSGKGYLTFALHDYLQNVLQLNVSVVGVELRPALVELCQSATDRLGLQGLSFFSGDVKTYQPEQLDVMIALHACDIATDYAIYTGIRLHASMIMVAPCCHKEVRPQLQTPEVLQGMLQHGIHQTIQAELLTDSLRATLMQTQGYTTKVFEFVALEHTSKNKMIIGIAQAHDAHADGKKLEQARTQYVALKNFYGVKQQCLETLLEG